VPTARIGAIHQDRRLPATISIDDLLGKHYAIVGSTGSGKSCTVALILRTILTQNPSGHVLLLDPHNEYTRAFGAMAEVIGPSARSQCRGGGGGHQPPGSRHGGGGGRPPRRPHPDGKTAVPRPLDGSPPHSRRYAIALSHDAHRAVSR